MSKEDSGGVVNASRKNTNFFGKWDTWELWRVSPLRDEGSLRRLPKGIMIRISGFYLGGS
jgi:hypothetical protein